jgi:hypothetical protein
MNLPPGLLVENLKTYTNNERHKKSKRKSKELYGKNENRKPRETKRMATYRLYE